MKDIAARGGNSVRAGGSVERILDEAQRLGMTVTVSLPMKMESVHKFDVHTRLGGLTPAQHRRGLRLPKLPKKFVVPLGRLPLAEGRVTFIRRVSVAGTVTVLSQSFRVGKRHRGLYLRLVVVDTKRGWLTAYLNGRVLKRWPYKLLND